MAKQTPSDPTLTDLVVSAVERPGDPGILAEVRRRAAEIARLLSSPDAIEDLTARLPGDRAAAGFSALYSALAEALPSEAAPEPEEEEPSAYDRGLEAIGTAFAEVLVPRLALVDPLEPFLRLDVPLVDPETAMLLAERPDVVEGGPEAERLTRYGFTPGILMGGVNAVSLAVQRSLKERRDAAPAPVWLSRDQGLWLSMNSEGRLLSHDALLEEVAAYAKGPPGRKAAQALYDWTRLAAGVSPFLYRGLVAGFVGDELLVTPTTKSWPDAVSRLRPSDAEDEAPGFATRREIEAFLEWRLHPEQIAVPVPAPAW